MAGKKWEQPSVVVGTLIAAAVIAAVIFGLIRASESADCREERVAQGRTFEGC